MNKILRLKLWGNLLLRINLTIWGGKKKDKREKEKETDKEIHQSGKQQEYGNSGSVVKKTWLGYIRQYLTSSNYLAGYCLINVFTGNNKVQHNIYGSGQGTKMVKHWVDRIQDQQTHASPSYQTQPVQGLYMLSN